MIERFNDQLQVLLDRACEDDERRTMILHDAIRRLVADLASGRFDDLEADGRAGLLSGSELEAAIRDYGRTLIPLPDEALALIDCFPRDGDASTMFFDVPLWTVEEGRSDLTLQLVATDDRGRHRLEITDLHVL